MAARTLPWRLAGLGGFMVFWQAAATVTLDVVIPPPARVAARIVEFVTTGVLWPNVARSLQTIATGFVVAYGAGLVIGGVMGVSRWWDGFLRSWLSATLMMPGLVVVIVVTMMLGLGQGSAVTAVVLTAVPYAALTLAEGVRAAPRDLLDMARAFAVGRLRRLRHVLLPALAPFLLTAARYTFSLCWKTTTLAEVVGGTRGVGFMMKREFQLFDMAGFVAWCVTFFAFTILVERAVLQRLADRAARWRPPAEVRARR